ncbi:MAG: hypothetical protein ACK53Y_16355, partial [bacterium]
MKPHSHVVTKKTNSLNRQLSASTKVKQSASRVGRIPESLKNHPGKPSQTLQSFGFASRNEPRRWLPTGPKPIRIQKEKISVAPTCPPSHSHAFNTF